MAAWARRFADGWRVSIHVQPGARKSEIVGLHGDALKIRVAAHAVEGRANAALVALIAERVGVAKSEVRVLRGEQSRDKLIEIRAPQVAVDALLAPAADQ